MAAALGVPYVSSGLLYRAVTVLGMEAGLDIAELGTAEPNTATKQERSGPSLLDLLAQTPPRLEPLTSGNRVWVGQRELTPKLHSSAVDAAVSAYASHPEVRAWVDARLRELKAPFVAEGRDMGTTVFPQASAKFYLTASPHVRATRRSAERPEEIAAIEAALRERDERDAAQSQPAADATIIDTGNLTAAEVIEQVVALTRAIHGQ